MSYSFHQVPQILKTILLHNWKAKLASLVIAVAIWFVIKRQVTTRGSGGAGGGSAAVPHLQMKDGDRLVQMEQQPHLRVEEPSWHLCGDFTAQVLVFVPKGTAETA